jgi:hypothetical protein
MRKHFFANEENGYLTTQQGRQQPIRNPITGIIKETKDCDLFVYFRSNNDDRNA